LDGSASGDIDGNIREYYWSDVAIKAIVSKKPYKTLFILENAENIIIGKTVIVCEVFNLAIRKNIFLAYQLK